MIVFADQANRHSVPGNKSGDSHQCHPLRRSQGCDVFVFHKSEEAYFCRDDGDSLVYFHESAEGGSDDELETGKNHIQGE